jgi:histidinol-phosphate aminotransferase
LGARMPSLSPRPCKAASTTPSMRPHKKTETTMHESANPWVNALGSYQPGKSASGNAAASAPIKLSSNENPYGGRPRIAQLLAGQGDAEIGRYPDDSSAALRAALAAQLQLAPENIMVGNGSSEILAMVARVFLSPGRQALISSYSFSLYRLVARATGAQVVLVPSVEHGHDLDALAKASADAHVVFIDNPCNPTGTYLAHAQLCRFLTKVRADLPVVIDEAYFEYATQSDYASCIDLIARHRNVLVVRTFSKAHGLAGVRLGYCIGDAQLIGVLNKVRQPFNVSALASQLGLAALGDPAFVEHCVTSNASERARLSLALARLDLPPVASAANFLFVHVGPDASELALKLEHQGVLVRALPEYPEHLRVTIGLPAENQRFLAALGHLRAA